MRQRSLPLRALHKHRNRHPDTLIDVDHENFFLIAKKNRAAATARTCTHVASLGSHVASGYRILRPGQNRGTLPGTSLELWDRHFNTNARRQSTPAVFLPILFLVMAFASYKFGQVGARQGPYAYFLLGLTTLVVATDGVTAPNQAWQIGLDRTEEIVGSSLMQ